MRKPQFEQFRRTVIQQGKPIPQQAREPYRTAIVALLEDTGLFLIHKSRKDGHNEALVEVHGSWVGTDFSPDTVKQTLRDLWPGSLFSGGDQMHWIESEEEIVTLDFAWSADQSYLTGHIKTTV